MEIHRWVRFYILVAQRFDLPCFLYTELQTMSSNNITWLKGKKWWNIWLMPPCLQCVLHLKVHFAIFVFFLGKGGLNVPWNKWFCDVTCTTPVLKVGLIFSTISIQEQRFSSWKNGTVTHKLRKHKSLCAWVYMWSPLLLSVSPSFSPSPLPQNSWERRQAVQSTTELAVSVCSLFIFKFISAAIGTRVVNLKNFFCNVFVERKWHCTDIKKTCT